MILNLNDSTWKAAMYQAISKLIPETPPEEFDLAVRNVYEFAGAVLLIADRDKAGWIDSWINNHRKIWTERSRASRAGRRLPPTLERRDALYRDNLTVTRKHLETRLRDVEHWYPGYQIPHGHDLPVPF